MKIAITYNIYKIRTKKRLSIRELSKLSGVSKTMINDIENNKINPSVLILCQLAVALGVKQDALFSYTVECPL